MTDAELLEKAARAAGTECQWFGAELRIQRPDKLWELWNPLADDGDALRLAVKLRLTIDVERDRCCISVGDHSGRFGVQPWGTEGAEAATRRAIVRAAAALPIPSQGGQP